MRCEMFAWPLLLRKPIGLFSDQAKEACTVISKLLMCLRPL